MFLATVFLGFGGLVGSFRGLESIVSFECEVRTSLISVPEQDRGTLWDVKHFFTSLFLSLPGFIAAKGERMVYYDAGKKMCGDHPPLFKGISSNSYDDVVEVLTDQDQPRGRYLGAQLVPEKCMYPGALIFVPSSDPVHSKTRQFLFRAIHAFNVTKEDEKGVIIPEYLNITKGEETPIEDVEKVLVVNLYNRLFGEVPKKEDLEVTMEYLTYGATCVLGESFQKLFFDQILNKVEAIRKATFVSVSSTPTALNVKKIAEQEGMGKQEIDDMIVQVVDGFMFAGMFGTSHLTLRALKRIRSNPYYNVLLWENDPDAFLIEQSRVDPPVTSVTALLKEDTTFSLGKEGQHKVTLPKGTTHQLVLSGANRDPQVFGGPSKSITYARSFDPTRGWDQLSKVVSFNGVESAVRDRTAPRGCIGHDLALSIAKEIIEEFKPTKEQAKREQTVYKEKEEKERKDLVLKSLELLKEAEEKTLLDFVGYVCWALCCFFSLVFIYSSTPGFIGKTYSIYLLGQFLTSVGYLYPSSFELLFFIGQIVAASSYYLIFLTYCRFSVFYHLLLSLLALFNIVVVSTFYFVFGSSYPHWALEGICVVFYGPAAALAFTAIGLAYKASGGKQVIAWGMVGAFFGCIDLFWPYLVADSSLYYFLSRLSDSLLYVPFVLPSILYMDRMMIKKVPIATPKPKPTAAGKKPGKSKSETRRKKLRRLRLPKMAVFVSIAVVLLAVGVQFMLTANGTDVCKYEEYDKNDAMKQHLCAQATEAMSKLDSHTKIMFSIAKGFFAEERKQNITLDGKSINIPKYKEKLPKKHLHFGVLAPIEDQEDVPVITLSDHIDKYKTSAFFRWLGDPFFHPLVDLDEPWKSLEVARQSMATAAGRDLPEPNIPWRGEESGARRAWDVTSDEAISMICFSGLAAQHLVRVGSRVYSHLPAPIQQACADSNASYVVDFSWMSTLEVRDGFERYGATVFIDEDANVIKMYWAHGDKFINPGEAGWEHVKWVFRSSLVTGVTLKDHLIGIHMMSANFLTTCTRENLSPSHPIRRFIRPHSYRTLQVNHGATKTLITKYSLLHRTAALTWTGLKQGMKFSFSTLRFTGIRDYLAERGLLNASDIYSWGTDMTNFENLVFDYVSKYIEIYYPNPEDVRKDTELQDLWNCMTILPNTKIPPLRTTDELVHIVTNFIVFVTAVHHHVGNVAEYLMDPQFASGKIRPGTELATIQESFQSMNIALLTGFQAPDLMNDFTHLLLRDEHIEKTTELMNDFQKKLKNLSEEMDNKNKQRRFPCNSANPKRLQCSVSI